MIDFFKTHDFKVGEGHTTELRRDKNNCQDGTIPLYRDVDGKLWGISGQTHDGALGMYCGTCASDLQKLYEPICNFVTGHAEFSFDGIRYPEGIKARGGVWPFGLYICPNTHRFFVLFHNESCWYSRGTGYDAYGFCQTPKGDSDFRHIGLMHSDDEGKSWTFDRWILTAEKPCYTSIFNPGTDPIPGQPFGQIQLGSGDFTMYVDPDGDYIYLFYNIIDFDMEKAAFTGCHLYVARSRKRTDGFFGDFVKYYNGSFSEAGIMGKESPIIQNIWHARVAYSEKYMLYFLSGVSVYPEAQGSSVANLMEIRTGTDLIHWSDPYYVCRDGKRFGDHYVAMVSPASDGYPTHLKGDQVALFTGTNGSDVLLYDAEFIEK